MLLLEIAVNLYNKDLYEKFIKSMWWYYFYETYYQIKPTDV